MASTYLTKTFGTDNSGVYKWTYSFWIKRGKLGTSQVITTPYVNSNNLGIIRFNSTDVLEVYDYQSNYELRKITNRVFRDTSAWYNIVISSDNSVGSPVFKLFINGVQETSFSTDINYPQNQVTMFNKNILNEIGRIPSQEYFDGSISHFHFIDGTQYDASTFGETDSTTGEWKIKTSPSVTYGTNGFFILKDGNSVTDQSGNSNNFTVGGGTLTKTEDNPSNVFATLNPLNVPTSNPPTFSNGNNTSITNTTTGAYRWGGSTTLGMTSGKFYCEAKATVDSTYSRNSIGITGNSSNLARTNESIQNTTASCGYYSEDGSVAYNGSGNISGFNTSYTTGDIIGMAFDLDNGKLYYSKNGTFLNSGNPTSGSTGTGAVSILAASTTPDGAYFFAQSDETGSSSPSKFEFNFGNGYFGTTEVSSAGTNASGNGIFEYDVPTGYTALSTKGLNL